MNELLTLIKGFIAGIEEVRKWKLDNIRIFEDLKNGGYSASIEFKSETEYIKYIMEENGKNVKEYEREEI